MSPGAQVLGTRIDALGLESCVEIMIGWARRGEPRTVCACNAHSLVSARRDAGFARALALADLRLPDGAPVAWWLRRRGYPRQRRVSGPDVMWRCCRRAAETGLPVFFYGATAATLAALVARLRGAWPALRVAGALAPPFRPLEAEEEARVLETIARSGARLVFVGLGCPKQELWLAAHRGALPGVALGAGAAFDFLAGARARAPLWMQRAGLEWLHRLACEPRRLGRRYVVTNSLFLAWTLGELLGFSLPGGEP